MTEISPHYISPSRRRMGKLETPMGTTGRPMESDIGGSTIAADSLTENYATNDSPPISTYTSQNSNPRLCSENSNCHRSHLGSYQRVPPICTSSLNSNGGESVPGSSSDDCESPPFSECSNHEDFVGTTFSANRTPCTHAEKTFSLEPNSNLNQYYYSSANGPPNGNFASTTESTLETDGGLKPEAKEPPTEDELENKIISELSDNECTSSSQLGDTHHFRGWSVPVGVALITNCDVSIDATNKEDEAREPVNLNPLNNPKGSKEFNDPVQRPANSERISNQETQAVKTCSNSFNSPHIRSISFHASSRAFSSSLDGNRVTRHESFSEHWPGSSCEALKNAVLSLHRLDDFNSEFLADGYFSHVYKVVHKVTNDVMVLKMNKPETSCKSSVLREVQLMNQLRHTNVIEFKGVCVDNGKFHALTEFCNAGSLDSLILNHERSLEWPLLIRLALDIAKGMEYVHSKGYIHRDLTAVNILLKGPGNALTALVGDFGLACRIPKPGGPLPDAEGNPYWRAPECLKEEWYDEKSDVFSLGIIACQMISRLDADPDIGLPRTSQFGLDYIRFADRCSDDTPVDFLRVAFSCCFMCPKDRPSCAVVVKDLFRAWNRVLPVGSTGLSPKTASHRRASTQQRRRSRNPSGGSSEINLTRSLSDAAFKSLPYLGEPRVVRTRLERRTHPEVTKIESAVAQVTAANGETTETSSEVKENGETYTPRDNGQRDSFAETKDYLIQNGSLSRCDSSLETEKATSGVQETQAPCKEREVEALAGKMAKADPFYQFEEYSNPFVRSDKLRSARKSFGKSGSTIPATPGKFYSLSTQVSIESPDGERLRKGSLGGINIDVMSGSTPNPQRSDGCKIEASNVISMSQSDTPEALRYSSEKSAPDQSTPKRVVFKDVKSDVTIESIAPDISTNISEQELESSKLSPCPICVTEATQPGANEKSSQTSGEPSAYPMRRCLSLPGSPLPDRAICPALLAKLSTVSGASANNFAEGQNPHQHLDSLAKEFLSHDLSFQAVKGQRHHSLIDYSTQPSHSSASSKRRNTVMPFVAETTETETSMDEDGESSISDDSFDTNDVISDVFLAPCKGQEHFSLEESGTSTSTTARTDAAIVENRAITYYSSVPSQFTVNGAIPQEILPNEFVSHSPSGEIRVIETNPSAHIIKLDPENGNGSVLHDFQKEKFRRGIVIKEDTMKIQTEEPQSLRNYSIKFPDSNLNAAPLSKASHGHEEKEKVYCSGTRAKDKCTIF